MYNFFLARINDAICPSTGCTEPAALALNAASARHSTKGEIRAVVVTLDEYLFKNAVGVGIPGVKNGRGIELCVALGLCLGDPGLGMNVLSAVTEDRIARAQALLPFIKVQTRGDISGLLIETVLETAGDCVRVITRGSHENIVSVEHAPFSPYQAEDAPEDTQIQRYDLPDFLDFVRNIPLDKLYFLRSGVEMNSKIAEAGLSLGLGGALGKLLQEGKLDNSPAMRAQHMAASASYARMSGVQMPVMTATGSGNQGITLTMTLYSAATSLGVDEEVFLRSLALAHLVNIFAKSFVGPLSAVCACGIASGLGASVGIVYMLGGGESAMFGAINNTLGAITGMVCDGAKEGCANKVALSAFLAVQNALLAVSGYGISSGDGILATTLYGLFDNLRRLIYDGMDHTNRAIVDIMKHNRR